MELLAQPAPEQSLRIRLKLLNHGQSVATWWSPLITSPTQLEWIDNLWLPEQEALELTLEAEAFADDLSVDLRELCHWNFPTTTSIAEWPPQDGRMLSSYPNPFNSTTRITWTADTPGSYRLGVYDLRGGLRQVLHEGQSGVGEHRATWSAEAEPGGLYFLRLSKDGKPLGTRKLLLLR